MEKKQKKVDKSRRLTAHNEIVVRLSQFACVNCDLFSLVLMWILLCVWTKSIPSQMNNANRKYATDDNF